MNLPRLEGYSVNQKLGEGGFGAVYRGTDKRTRRTVAIKVILPHLTKPPILELFQREISITQQLRHPNIVEVLDYGSADGHWYYVMEYLNGDNLLKLTEKHGGIVSLAELTPIMLEVLAGLAHAHKAPVQIRIEDIPYSFQGVVHRDLKPENILLAKQDNGYSAKVVDFGLAKVFESAALTVFTQPGEIGGTWRYWPREHIQHYKYLTPPSDVFSITAVFYETLTGHPIRDGLRRANSWKEILACIAQNPVVPIRKRGVNISRAVAEVIDRGLRETELPEPVDQEKMRAILGDLRYPDASGLQDALVEALNA